MTGPDNQLFQEARVMVNEEKVLLRLVDTLLPGGAGFPAASSTGMTQQVAARLHLVDANLLTRLAAVFAALGGLPQDEPGWCDATSRLEALEPKLFDEIRKYTYLTYYEQPAVIEAIRALGFHYNDAPLPAGYPTEPFERARDAPRHARGRWIPTDAVHRVDLSRFNLEESR
jgi:hypothetical protein